MPVERRRSRLRSFGPFAAGLAVGLAIGLPLAHAVVELVSRPVAASTIPPPAGPATPAATPPAPRASTSPSPSPSPTLTPGVVPPAPSPPCPALAADQPPLEELEAPPDGYRADADLGWLGCGTAMLPSGGAAVHLDQPWLLAISYTCPPGTAGLSPGTTLTVMETGPTPSPPVSLGSESGEAGRTIEEGPGGAAFPAGPAQLEVRAPAACLWHVALYPAQS